MIKSPFARHEECGPEADRLLLWITNIAICYEVFELCVLDLRPVNARVLSVRSIAVQEGLLDQVLAVVVGM